MSTITIDSELVDQLQQQNREVIALLTESRTQLAETQVFLAQAQALLAQVLPALGGVQQAMAGGGLGALFGGALAGQPTPDGEPGKTPVLGKLLGLG